MSDGFHGPSRYSTNTRQRKAMQEQEVASRRKLARSINPIEQDLLQSVHDKLSQQKFDVTIRAIIYSPDAARCKSRKDTVKSSLEVYSTPGYQALGARLDFPYALRHWRRAFMARHRLPTLFAKKCLLCALELASLYHFPSSVLHKAENTSVSRAKTLPAPSEMKRRADSGEREIILGDNEHAGEITPLSLGAAERARHLLIIGSTGTGKTTMMEYAAAQDVFAGRRDCSGTKPLRKVVTTMFRRYDNCSMKTNLLKIRARSRHVKLLALSQICYTRPSDLETFE